MQCLLGSGDVGLADEELDTAADGAVGREEVGGGVAVVGDGIDAFRLQTGAQYIGLELVVAGADGDEFVFRFHRRECLGVSGIIRKRNARSRA